jgi:lysine-specific permease
VAQGHSISELPYRAKFYPFGPLLALAMCTFVIVGQNYEALIGNRDIVALLSSYIGLPLFLALWVGHKLVTGEPAVRPEEADLTR